MSTKASLLLTAASLALGLSAATAAPAVTLFTDGTTLTALSGDGATLGGKDASGGFRLPLGGSKIPLAAYQISAISDDGSVFTGYVLSGTESQAFRWTQAAGFTYLRAPSGVVYPGLTLPRAASGLGISGDGSLIVGSYSTSLSTGVAITWANGASTATAVGGLSGASSTSALRSASSNGTVIVGQSQSTSGQQAYAKIGSGAVIGLGNFTSSPALDATTYYSAATAVSRDGTTIIGTGNMSTLSGGVIAPRSFAAIWKITGTTVGAISQLAAITLTDTALSYQGGTASFCNSDASVIVGNMNQRRAVATPNGSVSVDSTTPVIWSGTTYHHRILDLLTTAGVTGLTEAQFRSVTGISANGDVIIGTGDAGSWIVTGARALVGLSSLEVILPKVSVQAGSSNPVISYDTVSGQSYQVQRSTDLVTWANLGTAFSTAGQSGAGSNSVTDSTAPIGAQAFYRVTVQKAQ